MSIRKRREAERKETKRDHSTARHIAEQATKRAEEIAAEVKERTQDRDVFLKWKSCCGCGCTDMAVRRVVPGDSPLKDGDRIKEVSSSDKILGSWTWFKTHHPTRATR